MNKAPGRGSNEIGNAEGLASNMLEQSPVRANVRAEARAALSNVDKTLEVLQDPNALALARVLDVPAVASDAVWRDIQTVARGGAIPLALGALLSGCDASTVAGWLCGLIALGILGGGAAFLSTLRLRSVGPDVWLLMKRGGIGGVLGLGNDVNVHSGKSILYSIAFREEMAELGKVIGNFPDQSTELEIAKKKLGGDQNIDALAKLAPRLGMSPGYDAYLQPIEVDGAPIWFTWSVNTQIVDPIKYHIAFDPSHDYAFQSRKINDEIQPIVAAVIAGMKLKNMEEATDKRQEIASKIQGHPDIAKFEATYGIKLTIKLGDIQSPEALQQKAVEKLLLQKDLEMGDTKIEIAKKEGEAELQLAERRAQAITKVGEAKNAVLKTRVENAGGSSNPYVGPVAVALAGLDDLFPTVHKVLKDAKGPGSGEGSKK